MAVTRRKEIDIRYPGVTGNPGKAFLDVISLTNPTPDFDQELYSFLKDVDGDWFGEVTVPNVIASTPNAKIILWILANATTGDTRLQVDARPIAVGESIDAALTAMTAQDITVPSTAYVIKEVTFTLPTTGNFPIVAKDELQLRIAHIGSHGNDTLAVNTLLKKAFLEYDES